MNVTRFMPKLAVMVLIFSLSACASAPPPTGLMMRAESAMTMARQAEASQWAAKDLNQAIRYYDAAAELESRRKYDDAAQQAELAEAYALLAKSRSDANRLRADVEAASLELQTLKQKLNGDAW